MMCPKCDHDIYAAPPPAAPGVRPEVLAFAHLMEQKLRENDHRGGWRDCDPAWLLTRLRDEVVELKDAMDTTSPASASNVDISREAADVANFAMMIADLFVPLDSLGSLAAPPPEEPYSVHDDEGRQICLTCGAEITDDPAPPPEAPGEASPSIPECGEHEPYCNGGAYCCCVNCCPDCQGGE